MKKLLLILFSTVIFLQFSLLSFAEVRDYKITATIPAIIGVNTPPFTKERLKYLKGENKLAAILENTQFDITTEEIWREDQKVTLKTIVEK